MLDKFDGFQSLKAALGDDLQVGQGLHSADALGSIMLVQHAAGRLSWLQGSGLGVLGSLSTLSASTAGQV